MAKCFSNFLKTEKKNDKMLFGPQGVYICPRPPPKFSTFVSQFSFSFVLSFPFFFSLPKHPSLTSNGRPAHRRPDRRVQGSLQPFRQGRRWSLFSDPFFCSLFSLCNRCLSFLGCFLDLVTAIVFAVVACFVFVPVPLLFCFEGIGSF